MANSVDTVDVLVDQREAMAELLAPPVVYVPIRHHSPACSRALVELIERHRPAVVLVEGPPSFDDQIELLIDPTARMPLAIHSHVTFAGPAGDEPMRFGSYFPLCDYSPELVALRAGSRIGAKLGFIDLDYVDMARYDVAARIEPDLVGGGAGPVGAVDESYYRFSRSLTETARRLGCRDHNELWDQMVEANLGSPEQTLAAVLTYAAISRTDADPTRLAADGTTAREWAMAELVAGHLADDDATPVAVVTGAYHTVALPSLVDQVLADQPDKDTSGDQPDKDTSGPRPDLRWPPSGEIKRPPSGPIYRGHGLIRYGFERLEALSGYASGMPNPRWYQRVWENPDDPAGVTDDMLTEIAADLRDEWGDGQPSLPTLIDASAASRQLAALRRRSIPTRHDLIDAAVSCFTKGEDSAMNPVRLAAARRLTGFELGQVPDGTPRPPLAIDFDRTVGELGLRIDTSEPRNLNLDVYRSERDRRLSRFLHGLESIGVSFGRCTTRLQFRRTIGRELIRERWTVVLGPGTDSTLTEASIWGASIAEAVHAKTRSELRELLAHQPRSSDLMRVVMSAALRGVHSVVADGLDELRSRVAVDSDLSSVVGALSECELLWHGREPLGGRSFDALPDLARQLYVRACQLGGRLHEAPPEEQPDLVMALESLHQLLQSGSWDGIDETLFWSMLAAERELVPPGRLRGAIAGLEWRGQQVGDDTIVDLLRGHLDPSADPTVGADFLSGLLTVAREVLWEVEAVIEALSELFGGMDQPAFIRRVPSLRSAFTVLTPRETDRVAEAVRSQTGTSPNVQVVGVSEATVLNHELVSSEVVEQLTADDLGHWLHADGADTVVAAGAGPAAGNEDGS